MAPLLLRAPQQDTLTCHVPFCVWIHLCSSSGTDTAQNSARFSRKVVCCDACLRRKRCCLVCSSAACCLFVACSSHARLLEPRRHRCGLLVVCAVTLIRNYAALDLLLRRVRLLSCTCTRKMVSLLFRTPQPVLRLSVSGFICVHLLEPILHIHRFCELSPCLLSFISTRNMLHYLLFRTAGPAVFICNHLTEQDRFPLLLLCISRRNCCLLCFSG